MSGLANCAACNSTSESAQRTCGVISAIEAEGLGAPCSDKSASQWVRVYWGSDEYCGIGTMPVVFPDVLNEVLCCNSDGCNSPDSASPSSYCLTTASAITGGYCAGRTFVYRVCSPQQEEADNLAAFVSTVLSLQSPYTLSMCCPPDFLHSPLDNGVETRVQVAQVGATCWEWVWE